MGITGSIIVYVMIWWIIFFSILPVGIKSNKEIFNICKTFSLESKNQEKNLIETIKQNCRKIVKNKTGKRPFTNINIARI